MLDGDSGGLGGGHRFGTGRPSKTEFPQAWDDLTVVRHVMSVARFPDEPPVLQKNGRWYVHGVRDGVDVVVAVHPSGEIITGFPLPGGRGVRENPE